MKLTVVSDTHGNRDRLEQVVDANRDSDLFIHLGDGLREIWGVSQDQPDLDFVYVKGNCDLLCNVTDCPAEEIVEKAGVRIFCAHGHEYNIYSGLNQITDRANSLNCGIVLYGHTHISLVDFYNGVYIMNPGSLSQPRAGHRPSYGVITISDDGKVGMDIVEY